VDAPLSDVQQGQGQSQGRQAQPSKARRKQLQSEKGKAAASAGGEVGDLSQGADAQAAAAAAAAAVVAAPTTQCHAVLSCSPGFVSTTSVGGTVALANRVRDRAMVESRCATYTLCSTDP
jgi:cytochrome c1